MLNNVFNYWRQCSVIIHNSQQSKNYLDHLIVHPHTYYKQIVYVQFY